MKYPKCTLYVGLLFGLSSLPAVAATVDEVATTHNTTSTAQVLTVDGSTIQVNGTIDDLALTDASGNSLPDVDVYAIDVQANDALTFDIDCGAMCGTGSVDTKLTVFDSADMSVVWQANDDGGVTDPGSNSGADPFINFKPDATGALVATPVTLGHAGRIYVLVTYWGTDITTDASGTITAAKTDGGGQGDYQLIITGATPAPTTGGTGTSGGATGGDVTPVGGAATTDTGDQIINININPYYKGKWPRINPKSRGVIPVAILSQEGFDPANLVIESLRFGATGEEDSLVSCQLLHRDLNGDGVNDLLCFFSMRKAGFDPSSESAILTGVMEGGTTSVIGQAPLKMVPYKRHHHHEKNRNHRR